MSLLLLHLVYLCRVDFVVPELDAIGGYSVASPPSLMRKNGFIELAVKYSEYPPTYWIHTQVHADKLGHRLTGILSKHLSVTT
jgi:hypothetical protein